MKLLAVCLMLAAGIAQAATVYRYVDANGNVTFTNVPLKGAQPMKLPGLSSYSNRNAEGQGSSAPAPQPAAPAPRAPTAYPSVDPSTQRQRDGSRQQILQQELANEQKALEAAQKALTEGRATRNGDETRNYQKYLDRVQRLQDAVTDRQKNVEALQRELGQAQAAPK